MRARHTVSALLVAAALTAGALAPAAADDVTDQQHQIQSQINGTQDDLEAASRQVQAAAHDLAEAQAQLPVARAAYVAASGRLTDARGQLALIRDRLRTLNAQQDKVTVAITQAQNRIERSQTLIGRIVRYQYQTGGFIELQLLMDAQSPADLVSRLMAADSITDSQTSVLDQVTADQAVLTARQQELAVTQQAIETSESDIQTKVSDLTELTAAARQAQAHVEALVTMRADAMKVARQQRAAEQQRLNRLKAAQAALNDQITQQTSTGGGLPNGQLSNPLARCANGAGCRLAGSPGVRLPKLSHRNRLVRVYWHTDPRGPKRHGGLDQVRTRRPIRQQHVDRPR